MPGNAGYVQPPPELPNVESLPPAWIMREPRRIRVLSDSLRQAVRGARRLLAEDLGGGVSEAAESGAIS